MNTFPLARVLSWYVGCQSIFSGVCIFSPLYEVSKNTHGTGPIAESLASLFDIFGGALVVGGLLIIIGLMRHNSRVESVGLLILFITRVYHLVITIMATGLLPIGSWVQVATIIFLILALWINARLKAYEDAGA